MHCQTLVCYVWVEGSTLIDFTLSHVLASARFQARSNSDSLKVYALKVHRHTLKCIFGCFVEKVLKIMGTNNALARICKARVTAS